MNKLIRTILFLFLCMGVHQGFAQNRITQLQQILETAVVDQPGLDERFESSVNGVSLTQFIRAIADNHKLNLWVQEGLEEKVVNSFADAKVRDVLLLLCKEYNLDLELTGEIISIKRYVAPPPPVAERKLQIPRVEFEDATGFLSLDLKQDTLEKVAREITSKAFTNVVLSPDIKDRKVSAFILNRPLEDALQKMCYANGLEVKKDGNFFLISAGTDLATVAERPPLNSARSNNRPASSDESMEIEVAETGIKVSCTDVPIIAIIDQVSKLLYKNYFIYNQPEGKISLYIENASYEQFLDYILNGTKYTFKQQDGVYLIGERKLEGLRLTELVKLKHRTIEGVKAVIPQELQTDLDIKEFVELNAFILSGSYPKIQELKSFLFQIDQVVPVIMIEVLIVDVNTSRTLSTGISAGLGTPAPTTNGTISPGVDIDFSTSSINNLISSFNGLGVVNLGNVTPDFYLSIQALESDGVLRTRSTPKLSTLNGSESQLSIGRTEYYLETRNDLVGTQNPTLSQQQIWKSVNADLSINIKPIVSSAEQVTLEITVTQTDFTERISETAPPGSVRRDFESSIRVKNGEMILLGGLEDKSVSNSGSGLPLLARIPIIRWFFGNRTRASSNTKLNIFIRPTILY